MDSQQQLDSLFSALADPTRRAILARLTEGEATVGELAAPFDISGPAITKHLKVLEKAGAALEAVVTVEKGADAPEQVSKSADQYEKDAAHNLKNKIRKCVPGARREFAA